MFASSTKQNQGLSSKSTENKDQKDPQIQTISGNPEIGRVDVYFQTHRQSGGGSLPTIRKETGQYQAEILKELIKDKPTVIFPEGMQFDITPNDPRRNNDLKEDQVRELFPGGIEELKKALQNPTDEQLNFLEEYDAWVVYAVIVNPKVAILKTSDSALAEEIAADLSDSDPNNDDHAIFGKREAKVVKEVSEYLKKNPGSKVAVIYGSDHKTLPNQLSANGSEVKTYRWDKRSETTIGYRSDMVMDEKNPQIQFIHIKESKKLHSFTFGSILTEAGQLNALLKLDVDITPNYINSPEKLRENLLIYACSDKVRNEINRLYKDFKSGLDGGPFKAFSTINASNRLADTNNPKLQKEIIQSGATFYEWSIPYDLSPDLQRMIYSKIVRGSASREDLRKFLLEKITDKETVNLINKQYKSKTGPFT